MPWPSCAPCPAPGSPTKLFDGRAGTSTMTAQELLMVTAEIRSHHHAGKVGPLAIVAHPDQTEPFARVLGALALADRPMRLFDSPTRARSWLDAQPPGPAA